MSNISTPFIGKQMQNMQEKHHENKLFMIPFAENDVLDLQAMFVKPGIHVIKTKNILDGRKIITTILDSLNYYHAIGCISEESYIPKTAYDIIGHITIEKEKQDDLLINLENFFAIHTCFDFIWVELSIHIKSKCSLQDIKKIFNMFHVQERLPVLIVQYEDTFDT